MLSPDRPDVVRERRSEWLALAMILCLAAALRFSGLSWGLRHEPRWDEAVFVTNVEKMLVERDLDHRYYEYPGLMFYLLAPVLALAEEPPFGPRAYLAARGLVAACGVLAVALAWWLGRRLGGARAGRLAALVLAVSPIDVHTAHMLRPDVPLQVLVLLGLLAFTRLGQGWWADARSGLALGAAAALKFTGVFLVPAYVISRWRAHGRRWRGAFLALVVAAATFLVLSPYVLIHAGDFYSGAQSQVTHHYEGGDEAASGGTLAYYLGKLLWTLGPVGAVLAALGIALHGRRPEVQAVILHTVTTVAVLSTADVRFMRHLVPPMGGLAVLVGLGGAVVAARRPRAFWPLALAVASVPVWHSIAYVRDVARPSTWDRAVDWIDTAAPPEGASVVTELPLGLDRGRFEVLDATGDAVLDRRLALEADLVVVHDASETITQDFETRFVAEPRDGPANGPRIAVRSAPAALRPRYRALDLDPAWVTTSEAPDVAARLLDGDPETGLRTPRGQRTRFVQVDLPRPQPVGRIELIAGSRPGRTRYELEVMVRRSGSGWERVPTVSARPHVIYQSGPRPLSVVLLVPPEPVLGVRLVYTGAMGWGFAELRVDAVPGTADTG